MCYQPIQHSVVSESATLDVQRDPLYSERDIPMDGQMSRSESLFAQSYAPLYSERDIPMDGQMSRSESLFAQSYAPLEHTSFSLV